MSAKVKEYKLLSEEDGIGEYLVEYSNGIVDITSGVKGEIEHYQQ